MANIVFVHAYYMQKNYTTFTHGTRQPPIINLSCRELVVWTEMFEIGENMKWASKPQATNTSSAFIAIVECCLVLQRMRHLWYLLPKSRFIYYLSEKTTKEMQVENKPNLVIWQYHCKWWMMIIINQCAQKVYKWILSKTYCQSHSQPIKDNIIVQNSVCRNHILSQYGLYNGFHQGDIQLNKLVGEPKASFSCGQCIKGSLT